MHAAEEDAWGGCPNRAYRAPLTLSCLQETASACLDFLFSLQALTNNSKKASTKPRQLSMCFTANHCHSALCPRTHADTVLAMPNKAARNMLNVKPKWKLAGSAVFSSCSFSVEPGRKGLYALSQSPRSCSTASTGADGSYLSVASQLSKNQENEYSFCCSNLNKLDMNTQDVVDKIFLSAVNTAPSLPFHITADSHVSFTEMQKLLLQVCLLKSMDCFRFLFFLTGASVLPHLIAAITSMV